MTAVPRAGEAARRWLPGSAKGTGPTTHRLYVFPHAGAGAVSYGLGEHLPANVELRPVRLPGRENRTGEPPLLSVGDVADEVAPLIAERADVPYAFFGHSMGALLAFATARKLRALGAEMPVHLFLSAHRAPHLPDPQVLHGLPDADLLDRLESRELAGLDPELRDFLLPLLRADLTLCETYRCAAEEPLPCPFTVLRGTEDDRVTEADIADWRIHTSAAFTAHTYPGGHLSVHEAAEHLAQLITHTVCGRR